MPRSAAFRSLLLLCVVGTFISASSAQTCKSQSFTNKVFQTCVDLPVLNAFLHWTYFPSNNSVDIAYRATPTKTGDWVAWGINPTGTHMVGSQAIVGYILSGKINVITTNLSSYQPSMLNESLTFPVSNLAGQNEKQNIILFATLTLPTTNSTVNMVWQTGPMSGKTPAMHLSTGDNILSMKTLDLSVQTFKSQSFTNKVFQTCVDLPILNAFLHWTYFPSNNSVDIAYRATPTKTGDWVAWGINPTGTHMVGSQAIVGYILSGKLNVITTSLSSYQPSMLNESLTFPVSNLAGQNEKQNIVLFATLTLPTTNSTVNMVWQTGPMSGKTPAMHLPTSDNILSMKTLDLSIQNTSTNTAAGSPSSSSGPSLSPPSSAGVSKIVLANSFVFDLIVLLSVLVF